MEEQNYQTNHSYVDQIIEICFDSNTIDKYSPGLKLVFAQDDPPVFVNLKNGRSGLVVQKPIYS